MHKDLFPGWSDRCRFYANVNYGCQMGPIAFSLHELISRMRFESYFSNDLSKNIVHMEQVVLLDSSMKRPRGMAALAAIGLRSSDQKDDTSWKHMIQNEKRYIGHLSHLRKSLGSCYSQHPSPKCSCIS